MRRAVYLSANTLVADGTPMLALVVTDPSEQAARHEAESRADALRASEELAQRQLAEIEAVYRSAAVGLCVIDREYRYLRVNERLAAMHGVPAADHIGRTIRAIVPTIADQAEAGARRVFDTGEPILNLELTGETPAQPGVIRHWVEQWLPLRDNTGAVIGVNIAIEEVTERRRAERERAELLDRERRARAESEAANRAKDEFLAMLGHELRNPLSAIANALHVLDVIGKQEEQTNRARDVIRRQMTHLSALVDDLLDAARLASGRIVLTRRPVDLAEAVRRCLGTMAAGGRTERHVVRADLEPAWVNADETRIDQIITNLLDNAVKYTPDGGDIRVRVATDDETAVLEVVDTGVGIPAAMLPHVFDLFVQDRRTLDRAKGGLGIGLTLAHRLVELHSGAVHASSAGDGLGSTFTVRLPRIPAPAEKAAPTPPSAAGRTPPRRVLLVEDSDDAREMLRMVLMMAGHDVHEAGDGLSAVDAAKGARFDVALIDVGLPGLDGYEVARRIREGHHGKSIVLVAITGYGQQEARVRAHQAGFDAHLTKPVDPARLAEVIAAVTDARATMSSEGRRDTT